MTRPLIALVVLLGWSAVSAQSTLQSDLRGQLSKRIEEIVRSLDGVAGYAVVDLTSGEQVAARLEREPFPTASAIKVAILYELLKRADEGSLALDVSKPLESSQKVGGSGVLQH